MSTPERRKEEILEAINNAASAAKIYYPSRADAALIDEWSRQLEHQLVNLAMATTPEHFHTMLTIMTATASEADQLITPSAHYDKARNKMVRGIATYYDPTALVRRIQEAVNHLRVQAGLQYRSLGQHRRIGRRHASRMDDVRTGEPARDGGLLLAASH